MTEDDSEALRALHNIEIKAGSPPKAVRTFNESHFPLFLGNLLQEGDLSTTPAPIQSQVWPIAGCGHDCVGIAPTGCGKSLAYLLPAIVHANAQPALKRGERPIALVLVPTRELALALQHFAAKYSQGCRLRSASIHGGVPRGPQAAQLREGAEIVVATPGRLSDLIDTHDTNLSRVSYLVLDEMDNMVDKGFGPMLSRIVSQTQPGRQTLVFTESWERVCELATQFLGHDPIVVHVGSG